MSAVDELLEKSVQRPNHHWQQVRTVEMIVSAVEELLLIDTFLWSQL